MREAFKRFRRGVRALVSRRALDREMDDEMRLHVELETEELVRAGMPPIEARRRARLAAPSAREAVALNPPPARPPRAPVPGTR